MQNFKHIYLHARSRELFNRKVLQFILFRLSKIYRKGSEMNAIAYFGLEDDMVPSQ